MEIILLEIRKKCVESPVKECKLSFAAIQAVVKEQFGAKGLFFFFNFPRGTLEYSIIAHIF